jgi:replicative DNA helicase
MEFQRVEYERKLLVHLLKSERSYHENRTKLQKAIFSDKMLRWLYIKIVQYFEEGKSGLPGWDYFKDELRKRGTDDVKFLEFERLYRTIIETEIQALDEVDYYIDSLHEMYLVRENLAPAFQSIIESLEQGKIKDGLEKFIEAAGNLRAQTEETPIVRSEAISNYDNRRKYYLERKANPEAFKGFSTGIRELDRITGGVQRGEFAAVMAQTAGGKSIELLNVAAVNVLAGYNVLYFTLEMPYIQVETRWDSRVTQIEYGKFKKTELNDDEFANWDRKMKNLQEKQNEGKIGKFRIIDIPQGTAIEVIDSEIRLAINDGYAPDIIVIDYAGIMGSQKRFGDQWERHNDNAMRLKALARTYKIPGTNLPMFAVWTAYQLKDIKSAQKNITTDDLALARRIADHLDLLIALIRSEEDELEGIMRIPIVKYRDGGGTSISVRPDFSTMRIEERRFDDQRMPSNDDLDDFITA